MAKRRKGRSVRHRRRNRRRDPLLFFVYLVFLSLLGSGAVYLLVNQQQIMADIYRGRPLVVAGLVETDTPGLGTLLEREASGEIPAITFSETTGTSLPSVPDRLDEILPPSEPLALAEPQRLDLLEDGENWRTYLDLALQGDFGELWRRVKDWGGWLYRGSSDYVRDLYERVLLLNIYDVLDAVRDGLVALAPGGSSVPVDYGEAEDYTIADDPEKISTSTSSESSDPSDYGGDILRPLAATENLVPAILESTVEELETIDEFLALTEPPVPHPDPYRGLLTPAPEAALIELTNSGALPRISPSGEEPWRTYARPYNPLDNRPKVAVVVNNMGLNVPLTARAINMPGEVTLAFSPYAGQLNRWGSEARSRGHEFLLTLPMEPANFPKSDPGPYGLLIEAGDETNLRRLHYVLSRTSGYVGLVSFLGGRFSLDSDAVRPIMVELNTRGLLYLDTQSSRISAATMTARAMGAPSTNVDVFIDASANRNGADRLLRNAVRIARSRGRVVVLVEPFTLLLDAVSQWITTLEEEDLVLAPLSALVVEESLS